MTPDLPYTCREVGQPNTKGYRLYLERDTRRVSAWHDISAYADEAQGLLNIVVTAPRWTNARIRLATEEPLAPLAHECRNNKPRIVRNLFPHHGYPWNVGVVPQTWESPTLRIFGARWPADNGPLDVCEIGTRIASIGEVITVKVLGVIGVERQLTGSSDDRVTDWKLLVIDTRDPRSQALSSVADIEREEPGIVAASREWLQLHELPDGKTHTLVADASPGDRERALEILRQSHTAWRELVMGAASAENLDITVTAVPGARGWVSSGSLSMPSGERLPPAPMPAGSNKSFHIAAEVV
ncbi:inorganic pyrophosphatase [Exidia glandulosa HHB12029]|uniref:inorganic diphosphatase n=1 Tax=Exidia glandulosa HHB12029 TaxID=1314781 RepID=A0A165J3L4_EXIGL|nr:inorganic pyrophosphatase [Exidia glandulosa HHB12029]